MATLATGFSSVSEKSSKLCSVIPRSLLRGASFVDWLLLWLQENSRFVFDWDRGNQTKSAAKHAVRTDEAEEVFTTGQAVPLGVQISPVVNEERLGIVGTTSAGRILHVVFTLRDGKILPISARPAHKKERALYETYLREI